MNAQDLTKALGGRWTGASGVARCPAHDDREPSLSIRDGADGEPVVNCFAGCDWRDVKDALRADGLLPERGPGHAPEQRDTRRYSFLHDINVINLGLRISDIAGLETEDVYTQSPGKARLNLQVNGATEDEIDFLLDQRVELNAFASDDFVEWIEGKLEEHGVAKVIPDEDCLADAYRRALEQAFVQQKIDEVIDEAEKLGEDAEIPKSLRAKVEERLDKDSARTWDEVVRDLAMQNIDGDDVGDDE